MKFPKSFYTAVFNIISKRTGKAYPPAGFYGPAMSQLHRIFMDGITIRDIEFCMDEAMNKKMWPSGTGYLKRIHQTALKNRHEWQRNHQTVKINTGMSSIASLLTQR